MVYRPVVMVLAGLLLLVGCSSGDDSPATEDERSDALPGQAEEQGPDAQRTRGGDCLDWTWESPCDMGGMTVTVGTPAPVAIPSSLGSQVAHDWVAYQITVTVTNTTGGATEIELDSTGGPLDGFFIGWGYHYRPDDGPQEITEDHYGYTDLYVSDTLRANADGSIIVDGGAWLALNANETVTFTTIYAGWPDSFLDAYFTVRLTQPVDDPQYDDLYDDYPYGTHILIV
jgi:hypothetical protein